MCLVPLTPDEAQDLAAACRPVVAARQARVELRALIGSPQYRRLTFTQRLWASHIAAAAERGLLEDLDNLAEHGTPQEIALEADLRLQLAARRG